MNTTTKREIVASAILIVLFIVAARTIYDDFRHFKDVDVQGEIVDIKQATILGAPNTDSDVVVKLSDRILHFTMTEDQEYFYNYSIGTCVVITERIYDNPAFGIGYTLKNTECKP